MDSNNPVYDYIIIGGGITGLYASLILSKNIIYYYWMIVNIGVGE